MKIGQPKLEINLRQTLIFFTNICYPNKTNYIQKKGTLLKRPIYLNKITIFQQGAAYWESLIVRGNSQEVLSGAQERSLLNAIKYCNLEYLELSRKQVADIVATLDALREFGIE